MGILDYLKKRRDEAEAKRIEQEKADAARREKERTEEEQLKKTIAHSPIIDSLFVEFNKQSWILQRQSGKDKGSRDLCITSDTIEVKWSEWRTEPRVVGQDKWGIDIYKDHHIEEIYGQVVFSFTQCGYEPLDKCDFVKKRLLADVITERIATQIPGTYSRVSYGRSNDPYPECRTYYLPEPRNVLF